MGTALIYDEEMTKYKLLWVDPMCKIEVPERLTVSHEALVKSGLADRCVSVPVRKATDADILLVHSEEYLEAVKKTPYMTLEELKDFTLQYGDVYFHPNIYHCATLAAGAALQLVDSVMTGKVRNGMALVEMQNSDYLSVFCHLLLPVAYEFCPDLVLVCAGFDSAIGDPEGEMCATPDIFAHLTHLLMNLAGGKLCAVLEGGYNLTSLAQSVCQTVQTLLGDPAPRPVKLEGPCRSALESLHCVRSAHRQYWSCLKHAADLPTSDISTKHLKLADEDEYSDDETEWPEPVKRFAPAVRAAVVLPDAVACPDRCHPFTLSEDLDPFIVNKLKENFLKEADDGDALSTLSRLINLVERMEKNEICSGLALVPEISMATMCVIQHAASALRNRVLVVCVGDWNVPSQVTEDGKTLVLQFSNKESEESKSRYYIPVHLKKGFSDVSGFIQVVMGLLLPLGYEYDPSLVVLVRMSDSGLCDSAWQQLTGLLQGLAQGHTLVLMQDNEKECVGPTVSSLLGDPAPSLGPLLAPLSEDVESVEKLRDRLKAEWKLLQNTAQDKGRDAEDQS
nr:PREDICTED: histone deacetylase 10 [Paralichthys olivaceus]